MIIDKQGTTTVISQEKLNIISFAGRLKKEYNKYRNDNIIVNLFSMKKLSIAQLLEFLEISNTHRASRRSFVMVSDKVDFHEVPDELMVVPTLREAHDIIEMEEIERDLDF